MDLKALFTPFPVLATPNLILRALRPTDLNDLYAYASDPEIDRYVPWERYKNMDDARANLNEFLAEYEQEGFGVWGIEHPADQKLIGIINLSRPHRVHRHTEVGYTIARAYWGQGLATEALQAVIRFAFDTLNVVRVEAVVLPNNLASARVLEKAGMQFEGVLRQYQIWRGRPCDLRMYSVIVPPFTSG